MVIKANSDLYVLMEQGKQKAIQIGKPVLVSCVTPTKATDLSAFFAYRQDRYAGDRFFWAEPEHNLSFVGLGSVLSIEPNRSHNRFAQVEREWTSLLENSLVDETAPRHTGPLLFGGFSFDPAKENSELWQDFSPARFVVPQYMLTKTEDGAWLTVNRLVQPSDQNNEVSDILDDELASFEQADNAIPRRFPGKVEKEALQPEWKEAVRRATSAIRSGEMEKVVLARQVRLKAEHSFHIADILDRLLAEQTNAYVFAVDRRDSCFIGATPERLVKRTGREFWTLSLAGSIARGRTPEEDERLGGFLMQDVKNLHEHDLAVKMIKGAMVEICEHVSAPDAPILHKLKDIQHLATPISGQARDDMSLLHAVEMLHPTPALGGMPREAAVAAIRELEEMDRGWYAAPIGWLDRRMDGEFVAGIRSALVRGQEAVLFAGCGVVADSDPVSEYNETSLKFRPMLKALQATDTEEQEE